MLQCKSAQSAMELALLLALVVAVFSGMALYVRRSLQARYRDGAKYPFAKIEEEARRQGKSFQKPIMRQYQPYYSERADVEQKTSTITGGFPNSSTNVTSERFGWQKTNSAADAD